MAKQTQNPTPTTPPTNEQGDPNATEPTTTTDAQPGADASTLPTDATVPNGTDGADSAVPNSGDTPPAEAGTPGGDEPAAPVVPEQTPGSEEPTPEIDKFSGENPEIRATRGAEGEVNTEPEPEPVPVVGAATHVLDYDAVKNAINEIQSACNAEGLTFKLDMYNYTAEIVVPEGCTFPKVLEQYKRVPEGA